MGVDVLATQGARASATMIFTVLSRINSVPARQRLSTFTYLKICIASTSVLHYAIDILNDLYASYESNNGWQTPDR